MNLYELTGQFLQLQQMLEDPDAETDVINDTMEAVEGEIEVKAEGYAKVIKNMESNLLGVIAEQERLRIRRNLIESNIKRLKQNLQDSMIATGKKKFKTDLFSFAIQKNGGKIPVILDVKDTSELPDELVRIKEEADLDAIRQLIEKEGSCKYAHLGERGESLRIK
jgi:phosphotransferase system IIB component